MSSTPKEKKNCYLFKDLTLPVVFNKAEQLEKIIGYFNGFSVVIENPDQMKIIISKGYFGKANFSRCYPQFKNVHQTKILRERQFINRKKLFSKEKAPEKVILVPDSDIEDNSEQFYFTNLVTKYGSDYSNLTESVWLSLEEAFFLCSVLNCLEISSNNNKILDNKNLWEIFKNVQPNFIKNYVVYFYYRSKNYVVKPGIKFGGDFVLYKQGPPFYHSTFIVIVEIATCKFGNSLDNLTDRTYNSSNILGLNRLCESAGKELLICRIIWPEDSLISFEDFSNVEIKEYVFKRWIASQER